VQLLYPLGLFAIFSLVIPIIIHLWNVKQGKTLRIGSIALLGESSKLNSKSLKLQDWPLFLIRCLLLLILTVLLTEPYWSGKNDNTKEKGWVMTPAADLKEVYKDNRKRIDSLLLKGYKIHDFDYGFKEISLDDTVKSVKTDTSGIGILSLLKQLNSTLPKGFPVVLYAEKKLQQVNQDLPVLNFNLTWNETKTADSLKNKAVKFGSRDYVGTFNPAYTRFEQLKNTPDTGVINIAIFQDASTVDAKYLSSAISAIATYRSYKLNIEYVSSPLQLRNADLIFWLSPKTLTDKTIETFKKDARLFLYASGKVANSNSYISMQNGSQSNADPRLYKRVVANSYPGAAIWSDYEGAALLTKESFHGHELYKFYSRFNQSWTNLVWQDQFVRALIPIVGPELTDYDDFGYLNVAEDQRRMTTEIPNSKVQSNQSVHQENEIKKPLNVLFWILGFLLFCLERLVSLRLRRRVSHE
jgi:hypothetical protein